MSSPPTLPPPADRSDPGVAPPVIRAVPPAAPVAVPAGFGLRFDPVVRRVDGGRVLIGGSPLRLLRLSPAGATAVGDWIGGATVGATPSRGRLARRLLDAGVAHPVPPIGSGPAAAAAPDGPGAALDEPLSGTATVTVVIPAHGRPRDLERTLRALHASTDPHIAEVVVVDDASPDPASLARVAADGRARIVRCDRNGGPGAARNRGLATVISPVVAFVDCDIEPEPGWLDPLLAHLADPAVALVAPRVRAAVSGPDGTVADSMAGLLERYEQERSPLDLGADEARVAPGTRVAYVPSATLVGRTDVLRTAGGFDEALRVGEDVDLVWRLVEAGHTVRYEPTAVVRHPARPDLGAWVRQRFAYGTSAAALDARHPGSVAPVAVSPWTLGAWGLAALGHPGLGLAVGGIATTLLPRRLAGLTHPWVEAVRLAGWGQLAAGRPLASAITRTWWPIALGAAVVSRRARPAVVAAAVVPPALDWLRGDRALDPVRYVGLRLLDDASYGAGVWAGCRRTGRLGALRPALVSWPGRRPAVEDPRATPRAPSGAGAAAPPTATAPPGAPDPRGLR